MSQSAIVLQAAQAPEAVAPLGHSLATIAQARPAALLAPSQRLLYALPSFSPPDERPASDWYKRIEQRDKWAEWVVIGMAALSGLIALWVTNPTFGGQDYISAFLWGFGFQAAGNNFLNMVTSTGVLPER